MNVVFLLKMQLAESMAAQEYGFRPIYGKERCY